MCLGIKAFLSEVFGMGTTKCVVRVKEEGDYVKNELPVRTRTDKLLLKKKKREKKKPERTKEVENGRLSVVAESIDIFARWT